MIIAKLIIIDSIIFGFFSIICAISIASDFKQKITYFLMLMVALFAFILIVLSGIATWMAISN